MKNTNPIFSLKNFRSFGEDGADFELAPITVLTGCNSAGKSSLVKALMLISNQSTGGKLGVGISGVQRLQPSTKLTTSSKELKLGGFNNVINEKTKDGHMSISYRIWSNYLQEDVVCRRVFRARKDILDQGSLLTFTIEKIDGTIIYKASPRTYFPILEKCGSLQECEIEHMDEEEHFDVIENQYRVFFLTCSYADLSEKIKVLNATNNTKEDEQQIEDLKIEMKEIKKQLGDDLSNNYGAGIIDLWNSRWDDFLTKRSELERIHLKYRTNEEQCKEDKELFFTLVINEVVFPEFAHSISFIDSSTNEIRRIYNIESKDKLSNLLYSLINLKSSTIYHTTYFVNEWLKLFGIGDQIEIVGTEEGLGVKMYLWNLGEKRLLADEGYGITQLISILLQIELSIIKHLIYDNMNDEYHLTEYVVCIEEPEVHLHPKYQSLLAEMFVEAYQNFNIHFIIETHSEYLIRKLQVMVADKENSLSPNNVSLNYVEKDGNGISTNRKIEILEDGRLSESFGPGFFDEATSLSMHLLKMKMEAK